MAQQTLNVGSAKNAGDGDTIEAGGEKINANFTELYTGAHIHAATGKATPVDLDELALLDSAATFALKKLTWANLKATLKTYFDTLYVAIFTARPTYTPTITSGSGSVTGATITTTATVRQTGKEVDVTIDCSISNVGTGTPGGAVLFSVPAGATPRLANNPGGGVLINSSDGLFVNASSDGHFYVSKFAGASLWSNGNVFSFSCRYESA